MICRLCGQIGNLIVPCQCTGDQQFIHRQCLNQYRRNNSVDMLTCTNCDYRYNIKSRYVESRLKLTFKKKNKKYKSNFWLYFVVNEIILLITIFYFEPNWFSNGLSQYFIISTFLIHLIINLAVIIYAFYLSHLEENFYSFLNELININTISLIIIVHFVLFCCNYLQPLFGMLIELYLYLGIIKQILSSATKSYKIPEVVNLAEV